MSRAEQEDVSMHNELGYDIMLYIDTYYQDYDITLIRECIDIL